MVIEMEDGFCKCPTRDYQWAIGWDANSRPELHVICKNCSVRLVVPTNKFIGSIRFDKPLITIEPIKKWN